MEYKNIDIYFSSTTVEGKILNMFFAQNPTTWESCTLTSAYDSESGEEPDQIICGNCGAILWEGYHSEDYIARNNYAYGVWCNQLERECDCRRCETCGSTGRCDCE